MASRSLPALVLAIAAACSPAATGGDGDSGTGGDTSADTVKPDAFVAATVGSGAQSSACPYAATTPWVTVGVDSTGKPATTQTNSTVTIACSVQASGKGYDVSLSAIANGSAGGSFTVSSPAGQGAVTVAGGQVQASFVSTRAAATYQQTGCAITFTHDGSPIPDSPSLFPGRIWAHVSCPVAQDQAGTDTCDAEADFLFEECDP